MEYRGGELAGHPSPLMGEGSGVRASAIDDSTPHPGPLPKGEGEDAPLRGKSNATVDDWILARRPAKNAVDPWRPYHFLVEPERMADGTVAEVGTIFLTNRECPFRCLFCDLWKNTTDERVPDGAIAAQIDWALARMPAVKHLKLYNSGNFFDAQAIPPGDLPQIAEQLADFETLIVECHPRLVGRSCFDFQRQMRPRLQVAMGLETANPDVLARLNKQMTLDDFALAAGRLREHDIDIRAFILLRPPFLDEAAGIHWAKRSLDFAASAGVECCVVIPTRGGNGALEELQAGGSFAPPRLESLEEAVEYGISLGAGRVFADLWDIAKLSGCSTCASQRIDRLGNINTTQSMPPPVHCPSC
jgi:radical SAM enzyme (TIGR01210 family)